MLLFLTREAFLRFSIEVRRRTADGDSGRLYAFSLNGDDDGTLAFQNGRGDAI
jgi:hypothetical protein